MSTRETVPVLTKFEKARIIGVRALQLSQDAPSVLTDEELEGLDDPVKIATKELESGRLPFALRRHLPNGTYEDWNVSELKVRY